MITIGTHPDIPEAELQAYLNHANNTYPHRNGVVNITLDRFNNAKRAEVDDRVKHTKI